MKKRDFFGACRRAVQRLLAAGLMAALGLGAADAQQLWLPPDTQVFLAGHGADVAILYPRFYARVTSVGEPDADGNIYSFEFDLEGMAQNQLRSWRITFFTGERYAHVFQIRTNEGFSVAVTSLDGPLNGIAIGDAMLIEAAPIRRPAPQMREPAASNP